MAIAFYELREDALVDTSTEDSDIAESAVSECRNIVNSDAVVGEEGRAETVAEGEGMSEVNSCDTRVSGSLGGFALDNGCNVFLVFVTGKFGGLNKLGKEFDEKLPVNDERTTDRNARTTYSSPRRNSAVKARCSRDKDADSTPPYNSLSRMLPKAERDLVLCDAMRRTIPLMNSKLP